MLCNICDGDFDEDNDHGMKSKKQQMQVSASSPNFSMVETDVTTIKLTGLSPNTQVNYI